MTYARYSVAAVPLAGVDVADSTPPGQQLPPPIPGGTAVYYYAAENGMYPWGMLGYAGARNQQVSLPGGIVIAPDPERGVMRITMWWPSAPVLHVVRLHPDGSRHPVRGAYGLVVEGETRRNLCPNPSIEAGLNGYVPGDGNPTLTQITAPTDVPTVPSGTAALRASITAAGPLGATVPTTLTGSLGVTIGFAAQLSTRPTAMRVAVSWADASGGALTPNTVNLTANQINNSVNQWARQVIRFTPPAGAVTPTVKIIADGLPEGAALDLDALTVEQATTDGSFFDGDQLGGLWTGTRGLSESLLAPVQTLIDGECPLDLPVAYIVADPALAGGRATSDLATLASRGRAWLTHPQRAGEPVTVDLRSTPTLEHGINQGIFRPIGATHAVVVSALQRQAPTGTIAINAVSFAERDTLRSLFADAAPVLLRAPADYGYGPGLWLALGALTEDREGRRAWQDACLLSAPFVEVDPPIDTDTVGAA